MPPGEPPPDTLPPEETLAELYDDAPCAYLTMDGDGRIIRANNTAIGWIGIAREALIGLSLRTIMTPAARVFFETHVAPLLATEGLAQQVAIDLKCSDGHRMPVLSDWRGVVRDGRTIGIRAMFVDATDRRAYERDLLAARERAEETAARLTASEAELRELNETLERRVAERTADLERAHEQLRQSQKLEAMGSLTGGVAHDFNNLLTPIVGALDLLRRRHKDDERTQGLIGRALQAAERATTLTQRLLSFARRQALQPRAVDIGGLIEGIVDLIRRTLGPSIAVVLEIGRDLPSALVDPNQLELALLNLAINARDAMPKGGRLTLSVSDITVDQRNIGKLPAGKFIRLVATDTGFGMDAATLAKATEPFFSTKGVGKGTGLGLSMVHGLTAQSGGTLKISSEPGVGTAVELWLPATEDVADTAVEPRSEPVAARRRATVLLVDDEDVVRLATADMLRDIGYDVIEVSSGSQALTAVRSGVDVDVLVTDYLMPGMTGGQLIHELRDMGARLPALLVTGYAAEAEDVPPDVPRLAKPFRQVDLAARVDELCRH